MNKSAVLNCEEKSLKIEFKGEEFFFYLYETIDLKKYIDNGIRTPEHNWHILHTKDGKTWGLQFIWIKELDGIMPRKPRIKIYELKLNPEGQYDTCNMERIPITKKILGHYDYFYQNEDWWDVVQGMKIERVVEFKM